MIIDKARVLDGKEVTAILNEYGMGFAADLTEHTVLRDDGEICAIALLMETDANEWHLPLICVKEGYGGRGYGKKLLLSLLEPLPKGSVVRTVARGVSKEFYVKIGFVGCQWEELSEIFSGQCGECEDFTDCSPSPLVYAKNFPTPTPPGGRGYTGHRHIAK